MVESALNYFSLNIEYTHTPTLKLNHSPKTSTKDRKLNKKTIFRKQEIQFKRIMKSFPRPPTVAFAVLITQTFRLCNRV